MKKLEFETSKGKFVLVDLNNNWFFGENFNYYGANKFDALNIVDVNESFSYSKSYKLSEILEEEAIEIVDNKPSIIYDDGSISLHYRNYLYHDIQAAHIWKSSAIGSLHSLFQSKGIHLFENPIDLDQQLDCNCDMCYQKLEDAFDEAEEKTFYNPYIFKL